MEMGDFMEPDQQSAEPGKTPRSCQRIWSFFIMGSEGFQGGRGR